MTSTNTINPFKVIIVGAGAAGTAHARASTEMGGRVVGVIDPEEARARAVAERFGAAAAGSLETLGVQADVGVVCTPSGTHADTASALLDHGLDVLVEKPFDVRSARVYEVQRQADAGGRVLGTVAQHRFGAGALRLRDIVISGEIGAIMEANIEVRRRRSSFFLEGWRASGELAGGGVLFTVGFHYLDLLAHFLGTDGQVTVGHAHADKIPIDSLFDGRFLMAGVHCNLSCAWGDVESAPDLLWLRGKRGCAELRGGGLSVWASRAGRSESGDEGRLPDEYVPAIDKDELHRRVWEDFFCAVVARRAPRVRPTDVLPALHVLQALYSAAGAPDDHN